MDKAAAKAAAKNMRQFVRVKPEPYAPVKLDINGEGMIEVTKAIDISEGGICIRSPHRFEGCHVDEPVSFIVHLPPPVNGFFRVEGQIKHVKSDLFGVQFINLSEKSRMLLRRYIAQWLREHRMWDYIRYTLHLLR